MKIKIVSPRFGRFEVLIDDADTEAVLKHTWHVIFNSYDKTQLHAVATSIRQNGKNKTVYLHKLITGYSLCDHIDGDVLNNQKSNLRQATRAENCKNQNKHSNNTSGYKGVHRNVHAKKWQALIMSDGFRKHLGYFTTKEEAATAYNIAATQYHGKFARLNIIRQATA